jgi:hypothetical protein
MIGITRTIKIDNISVNGIRISVHFPNLNLDGVPPTIIAENYMGLSYYPEQGLTVQSGNFTDVEEARKWIKKLTMDVQGIVTQAEALIPKFRELEGTEKV